MAAPAPRLILGARQSPLAQWQTGHVAALLQAAWPGLHCQTRPFTTRGDRSLDQPLPEIGGKGLFTAELEEALRAQAIDVAVHSLKDLPVEHAPGLALGAIVAREDVRDVLVAAGGHSLASLPAGAVVGTSSLRRQAQLARCRPDLQIRSIRGNVDTRIRKVLVDRQYDATVLAAAGVTRLGLQTHVSDWLPLEVMLPAPGQAALAVQCRAGDAETLRLLAAIDDATTRRCVTAERSFLHHLQAGCSTPVAAWARPQDGGMHLVGLVIAPDGRQAVQVEGWAEDAVALGASLAHQALAQGAGEILTHV